mmetsp:Transcript_52186/g.131131  ORF Transcript_52186/g.131131 Transcript_52186/m.131131 type:complete len:90 (+) Transcript_52186:2343-2612(+)
MSRWMNCAHTDNTQMMATNALATHADRSIEDYAPPPAAKKARIKQQTTHSTPRTKAPKASQQDPCFSHSLSAKFTSLPPCWASRVHVAA